MARGFFVVFTVGEDLLVGFGELFGVTFGVAFGDGFGVEIFSPSLTVTLIF